MRFIPASWLGRGTVAGLGLACLGLVWVTADMLVARGSTDDLSITYPFDGSLFPPEIIPPVVWWQDNNQHADEWRITVAVDGEEAIQTVVDTTAWTPHLETWEWIKSRTIGTPATITVESLNRVLFLGQSLAKQNVSIATSPDSVGAPIYYREVPLPFRFALRNVPMITWRLGDIGSPDKPQTVLTNLPVCGNCHSFSADGKKLGMDVDIGNDKGAYVLTSFEEETELTRDELISWSSFVRDERVPTFGMLPRVSPTGRYVVAGVRDRTVFLQREDITFSQIFFPVMGILAYFDERTGRISALPGADDERYVQSNAVWTPDEEQVIFARSHAVELQTRNDNKDILLTLEEAAEVLGGHEFLAKAQEGGREFKFDLYRLPFNNGRGGRAEPIEGASENDMSNFFPKVSPDGRWLVFTQSHSFMLLQPDSKMYIMPAEGGEPRLMNANTDRMNSWHSWSPNGRWMVFSSKVFSPYTQLFLTHIDEDGHDTPPVLLRNFTSAERAANIPEFVNIDPKSTRSIREMFIDDYNYFRSGRIYEQFEEFDRAEEEFLKSLEINPENTSAWYSLGTLYAEREDFEEAERIFERIVEIDPNDAVVHKDLGTLYFSMGRHNEARAEFETAVRLDPNNVAARFNLATLRLMGRDLVGAELRFHDLLALDLDDSTAARVHVNLGRIYAMQRDFRRTAREFSTAVSLDSTDMDARYNLGVAYRALNEHGRAREQFEEIVEADPTNLDARNELGRIHAEQREFQSAIREFDVVVEQDPRNIFALMHLARIYQELNRYTDAERVLLSVIDVEPNNVFAHVNLGQVYGETRDYAKAVSEFRAALEADPNDPRVSFMLGEALAREDRSLAESMAAYQTGLRLDPNNREAHISLGEVCLRAGDRDGAIREFQAALALNPTDEDRQYLEAQLADLRSPAVRP
jgi:tetratricopeptide (TPR) repeat protein